MVDAGVEAQIEVRVDDLARDVADVLVADAGVVFALRRREAAVGGKPSGTPSLRGNIPARSRTRCRDRPESSRGCCVGCGVSSGSKLRTSRARRCLRRVGKNGHRLEHAIRARAFGLARRAAVEAPAGEFFERRETVELLDLGFAAEIRDRLVAVEPDVLEFVLRSSILPPLRRRCAQATHLHHSFDSQNSSRKHKKAQGLQKESSGLIALRGSRKLRAPPP